MYYQVVGNRGDFLAGAQELPAPSDDERAPAGEMRLRETQWRGQDWKVAYMWVGLDLPGDPLVLVQVAETMEKRAVLAKEIVRGVMLPRSW